MINKKDITAIIAIAILSGVISLVISNLLFGGSKTYNLKAPQAQPISADFITPDAKYFNSQSINLTVDIEIGGANNPDALGSENVDVNNSNTP